MMLKNPTNRYKKVYLFCLSRFFEAAIREKLIKDIVWSRNKIVLGRPGSPKVVLDVVTKVFNGFDIVDWPRIGQGLIKDNRIFKNLFDARVLNKRDFFKINTFFVNSFNNMMLGLSSNPNGAFFVDTESKILSGHISYPFPKIRLGLTDKESLLYSNERRALIDLPVFSFKAEKGRVSFTGKTSELARFFDGKVIKLPIHPWNLSNLKFVKKMIKTGILNFDHSIKAKALTSIRSLRISSNLEVKLSLGAVLTSEKRVIYQDRAHNAPIISSILNDIINNNQDYFLKKIDFQENIFSIRYRDFIKGPFLSAIFRKRPSLQPGRYVLPANYLFDPFKREIPISNEIKKFIKETKKSPLVFFKKYSELIIVPTFRLLLMYGIGLEPHLQNSFIEFKSGIPERLIMRDTDGVNIDKEKLLKFINIDKYDFYPETWKLMHNEAFSLNRILHAAIFSHVVALASFLKNDYKIDEFKMWRVICGIIKKTLDTSGFDTRKRLSVENKIFGRRVNIKCLLKMRLKNTERFITVKYPNPLFYVRK